MYQCWRVVHVLYKRKRCYPKDTQQDKSKKQKNNCLKITQESATKNLQRTLAPILKSKTINYYGQSFSRRLTLTRTHLQVKDTLINHYGQSLFKKSKFDSYSRRCSIMQQVTSILATRIHRLEEKGPVLVAWGDGQFSPSFGKGYPTTPIHSIKDMLSSKIKNSFILVD